MMNIIPNINTDLYAVTPVWEPDKNHIAEFELIPIIGWAQSDPNFLTTLEPVSIENVAAGADTAIYNLKTGSWWLPETDTGVGTKSLLTALNRYLTNRRNLHNGNQIWQETERDTPPAGDKD